MGREDVLGAGVIGLNPLHALRKISRRITSAPMRRTADCTSDELYIDLERLPEFYRSEKAQQQFLAPEFQVKLQALRESRQVDYDAVATAKRTMLDFAYRKFLTEAYSGEEPNLQPKTARAWLLERFIQSEGTPLEVYATFQTLEEERRLDSIPESGHLARLAQTISDALANRFVNMRNGTGSAFASFNTFSGWRANS